MTSGRAGRRVARTKVEYGPAPSQFGHFYHASDAADRSSPMRPVVLVHGGSWSVEFGLTIESAIARQYAELGAAVWNVEYRRLGEDGGGWPGCGRDVVAAIEALDRVVPAAIDPEVNAAIDWSQVAVVGHSAGGQLALWATAELGARTRSCAITTVVAQSAALDLVAAGKAGKSSVRELIGRDHSEAPHRYREASPAHLDVFDAHVVAVHTEQDEMIGVDVSRRYVADALARGQSAELVVVPGEGHSAFVEPRSAANRQTIRALGL